MAAKQCSRAKVKDAVQRKAQSMLLSSIPVKGDYFEPEYQKLIHKAVTLIYESFFCKTSRNMVAFATCCRVWGEKRNLRARNHLDNCLNDSGQGKVVEVTSRLDLLQHVIGPKPTSQNEPWVVQFPRTAVDCGYMDSNDEYLVYLVY
jgi:hypothetical protein